MKKILITGGCGFIGSNLVDFLISKNYEVHVIDNLLTGKLKNLNKNSIFHHLDLSEGSNINEIKNIILLNKIEFVFHLAAVPNVQQSIDQPSFTHANTLTSTINLLESIRNTSVKKLIFSSTSAIYGNTNIFPTNEELSPDILTPYALQKFMSEQYIKLYSDLYDIKSICLRYFNVFGNRMTSEGAYKSVLSIFKEQKLNNQKLTITNDGEQLRDFIHVDDVVYANYLSMITDTNNFEIFNVGSGTNYSVNEIAKKFKQDIKYIGQRTESKISLCDNTKIKKYLNWNCELDVLKWIEQNI